jgi:hypothetical protein
VHPDQVKLEVGSCIISEYDCIRCTFLAPVGVNNWGIVHCYWPSHPVGVFGLGSVKMQGMEAVLVMTCHASTQK